MDRFLLEAMRRKDLAPSPPADARTLIRRMTYDMHGLPPSIDEVEAFAADHARDPDALHIRKIGLDAVLGHVAVDPMPPKRTP